MYNERAYRLGSKRSTIREIFEYAKARSAEIGAEKVFDFSCQYIYNLYMATLWQQKISKPK